MDTFLVAAITVAVGVTLGFFRGQQTCRRWPRNPQEEDSLDSFSEDRDP